jgi:hypothetical protein
MQKHWQKVKKLSSELNIPLKEAKKLGIRRMRDRLKENGHGNIEKKSENVESSKANTSGSDPVTASDNNASDASHGEPMVPTSESLGKADLIVTEAPAQPESEEIKEQFFRASVDSDSSSGSASGAGLETNAPPEEQYLIRSKLIDVKLPSGADEKKPFLLEPVGAGVVSFMDNRFRKAGVEPLEEDEKREITEGAKEMFQGLGIFVHPIISGTIRFILGIVVPPLKRGFWRKKPEDTEKEKKTEPAKVRANANDMNEAEKRYQEAIKKMG